MTDRNKDLLYRSRPVSSRHKPMPMRDRAAQFLPFAALSGFDAAIEECCRRTGASVELSEQEKELLDWKLQSLRKCRYPVFLAVTWFVADEKKEGGRFQRQSGYFSRIDEVRRQLELTDGTRIALKWIRELEWDGYSYEEEEGTL